MKILSCLVASTTYLQSWFNSQSRLICFFTNFTSDTPFSRTKITVIFSISLRQKCKVFYTVFYIVFIKWGWLVPLLLGRNIWSDLILTPFCLVYSLTQVWTTLKTSRYLEFREVILSKTSSPAMILAIKFGTDSVFSLSWLLEYNASLTSSFSIWPKRSWLQRILSLYQE